VDQHLHIFQTRSSAAYAADSATFLSAPQVPECPWIFVHENHPVINLLRINKHLVGVDVDDQPKMEGQWHKVTQSLFDSSCDTIKTRILSKLETKDLNELSVTNPLSSSDFCKFACCNAGCWVLRASLLCILCEFHLMRTPSRFPARSCNFTASGGWTGPTSMARMRSCPSSQTQAGTTRPWRPTSRHTSRASQTGLAHSWPAFSSSMRCRDHNLAKPRQECLKHISESRTLCVLARHEKMQWTKPCERAFEHCLEIKIENSHVHPFFHTHTPPPSPCITHSI